MRAHNIIFYTKIKRNFILFSATCNVCEAGSESVCGYQQYIVETKKLSASVDILNCKCHCKQ